MDISLKQNIKLNWCLFFLSALALLSGFCAALFDYLGFFFFPTTVAFYSAVLLLDNKRNRIYSVADAILLLLVDTLLFPKCFLISLFSVLASLLVFYMIKHSVSKSEASVYLTLLVVLLFTLMIYFFAVFTIKTYSISAVKEFYLTSIDNARSTFLDMIKKAVDQMQINGDGIAQDFNIELFGEAFDLGLNLIISVIVVLSFMIAGFSLKLVRTVLLAYTVPTVKLVLWRFRLTSVFAYFYLALIIMNAIIGADGIFAISVMNLYIIFMFVFAYVGFTFASLYLSTKIRKIFATVTVISFLLIFNALAIELLSYLGAFVTVMASKIEKNGIVINTISSSDRGEDDENKFGK